MDEMLLVIPTMEYKDQIESYRQDFLEFGGSMDGAGSLRRFENAEDWIKDSEKSSNPETVPEGLVPATQFIYVRKSDGKMIGVIQVRHYLNEYLKKYAGHIGYSVRPSERRKGYAKRMLHDVLPYCKEIGMDKVMISCIDTNEASRRTILANGGIYESTVYEPDRKRNLQKYWIDLSNI